MAGPHVEICCPSVGHAMLQSVLVWVWAGEEVVPGHRCCLFLEWIVIVLAIVWLWSAMVNRTVTIDYIPFVVVTLLRNSIILNFRISWVAHLSISLITWNESRAFWVMLILYFLYLSLDISCKGFLEPRDNPDDRMIFVLKLVLNLEIDLADHTS